MKRALLILVFTLFAAVTLFGVVIYNHGEFAYNGDDDENKTANNPLKTLIITGAGHFIQSHAGFQLFLHKIELAELSGVNYDGLRRLLNEAISSLESAKTAYDELKNLAYKTPYNLSFISALESFNYNDFKERHNLNAVIFSRLAQRLSRGNVTGVFEDIYNKTDEISALMHTVKKSVDKDIFPDISLLWEINQVYFDSYLFGQYAAMIFKNIKQQ